MNDQINSHSSAWINFNYLAFTIAAGMMAGGIFFMDAGFAAKGFYSMAAIMLVHTAITVTKTLRDNQESGKLINKIEDAKTEKLLMDINRSEAA